MYCKNQFYHAKIYQIIDIYKFFNTFLQKKILKIKKYVVEHINMAFF